MFHLQVSNFSVTAADPMATAFPEKDTEGLALFKRGGRYYLLQGSCCCQCTWGSSLLVYTASKITGPWVRGPHDLNPVRNGSAATSCQLQCHSAAATGGARCNHTIHGQLNSIGVLHRPHNSGGTATLTSFWAINLIYRPFSSSPF